MDDVVKTRSAVAVGPLEGTTCGGRFKNNLLTTLSLPLGWRDLVGISEEVRNEDIDRLRRFNVQYVVWDDQKKIPEFFHQDEWRIDRIPGFLVFSRVANRRADGL